MKKIAVISDSHDEERRLENLIKRFNQAEEIKDLVHCGDLCAPFMVKVLNKFSGRVYISLGYSDGDLISIMKNSNPNLSLFKDLGELKVNNGKIAFIHNPTIARLLASSSEYKAIFYGHTHEPEIKKVDGVLLVNPGEIKGRKEEPTYCIYNPEKNEAEIKKVKL